MTENYNPQPKTAAILDRALEIIGSVPYRVSARWVFYRLLQEGHYASKDDYKNRFLPAVSSARHAEYDGWRPDTLADETRQAIVRGAGFDNVQDWLTALAEQLECNLDRWPTQPCYVELWYEARAMTDQFRHYTELITLRPMGGEPSIPYKYAAAQALEEAACTYQKPVYVLYFGDLDPKGLEIAGTIETDVQKWCGAPFTFVRVGLTAEQVKRYDVPENFEHPGAYQWEALTDDAAREIITSAMDRYINPAAFSVVAEKEQAATLWLRDRLAQIAGEYHE